MVLQQGDQYIRSPSWWLGPCICKRSEGSLAQLRPLSIFAPISQSPAQGKTIVTRTLENAGPILSRRRQVGDIRTLNRSSASSEAKTLLLQVGGFRRAYGWPGAMSAVSGQALDDMLPPVRCCRCCRVIVCEAYTAEPRSIVNRPIGFCKPSARPQ